MATKSELFTATIYQKRPKIIFEIASSMAIVTIKVTPRAKQNKIIGYADDVLRVHITAPPIGGKANKALIAFLSDAWDIPKSSIRIVRGESAREKVLEVPDSVPLQKHIF